MFVSAEVALPATDAVAGRAGGGGPDRGRHQPRLRHPRRQGRAADDHAGRDGRRAHRNPQGARRRRDGRRRRRLVADRRRAGAGRRPGRRRRRRRPAAVPAKQ